MARSAPSFRQLARLAPVARSTRGLEPSRSLASVSHLPSRPGLNGWTLLVENRVRVLLAELQILMFKILELLLNSSRALSIKVSTLLVFL